MTDRKITSEPDKNFKLIGIASAERSGCGQYVNWSLHAIFLLTLFSFWNGSSYANPYSLIQYKDSADIFYAKAMSIKEDQTFPDNIDSVKLKIKYLEQAISFRDVDSLYFFLGDVYLYSHVIPKFKKLFPRMFKAKIRTKIYDNEAMHEYADMIFSTKGNRKELKIYQKMHGDTVLFMGQKIHCDTINDDNQTDVKESIEYFNDLIDETKTKIENSKGNNPCAYADIAKNYSYQGNSRKAKLYLKRGLKKFPDSGCLNDGMASFYYRAWKLKKAEFYYKRAFGYGYKLSEGWAEEMNFLIEMSRK